MAVSPETAAVARGRKEVDERRLSVIPNGIILGRFHPDTAARARIRSELGIPESSWVVGTVGRIAAEKNQALLLRAAAPLLGLDVHLVVAGDGPLRASLSDLVSELGVAPFVHLLGARVDVPDVLNAMDAFVLLAAQLEARFAVASELSKLEALKLHEPPSAREAERHDEAEEILLS